MDGSGAEAFALAGGGVTELRLYSGRIGTGLFNSTWWSWTGSSRRRLNR